MSDRRIYYFFSSQFEVKYLTVNLKRNKQLVFEPLILFLKALEYSLMTIIHINGSKVACVTQNSQIIIY